MPTSDRSAFDILAQVRSNGSNRAKVNFLWVEHTICRDSVTPSRRLEMPSNSNRGVVYLKPGSVEVQNIDFPTFRDPAQISIGTRAR